MDIQQTQWIFILLFLPIAVAYTKNAILTIGSAIPLLLFIISELHAWIYAIIKLLK